MSLCLNFPFRTTSSKKMEHPLGLILWIMCSCFTDKLKIFFQNLWCKCPFGNFKAFETFNPFWIFDQLCIQQKQMESLKRYKTLFGRAWLTKHRVTVWHNWVHIFVNLTLNVTAMIILLTKKNSSKVSVMKRLFKHPSLICPNPLIIGGKLWNFPRPILVCLSVVVWQLQILEKTLGSNIKFRKEKAVRNEQYTVQEKTE